MKSSFLSLTLLTLGLFFASSVTADTVILNLEDVDDPQSVGDLIDNLTPADLPATFAVPNDAGTGLTIAVTSIVGLGDASIFTSGAGLGVSDDSDLSNFFGAGESVSFVFNLDVSVNAIEFFSLGLSDSISVNGTTITAADETGASDLVEFSTPIDIAAGSALTFAGVTGGGTVAVENVTLHVTPVPEPASAILLAGIGLVGLSRRRR